MEEPAAAVVVRGQACSPYRRQIRGATGRGAMMGPVGAESGGFRCREKLRCEGLRRPYRKPTQVVR